MIPAPFAYVRAESVDEALEALADPEAKALAGGHSLLPMMKLRFVRPARVVDIGRLELRGVAREGNAIRIGALTSYDALIRLLAGEQGVDALSECASRVGDLQVRNGGTVGGGLAHGDPASDIAAGAIALGVQLRLRSPGGVREVPIDEFFIAPFTTALEQQELLVEVVVEPAEPGEGSAYVSSDDPASGYSIAGAAARVRLAGERIARCTIGLTGVAPTPIRARTAEEAIVSEGGAPDAGVLRDALASIQVSGDDAVYRRHLLAVVTRRAVMLAAERARSGGGMQG